MSNSENYTKIKSIPVCAYANNESIVSFIIPEQIRTIRKAAFWGCKNLKTVELPPTCRKISKSLFQGCTNLEEIMIPEGVEKIEDYAFFGCKALCHVVIPDTVKSIGIGAFADCDQLKKDDALAERKADAFSVPFETLVSNNAPYAFIGLYYMINGKLICHKYPCSEEGEILITNEQERYQISFDSEIIWEFMPIENKGEISLSSLPHGSVRFDGSRIVIACHNPGVETDELRRQVRKEFGWW